MAESVAILLIAIIITLFIAKVFIKMVAFIFKDMLVVEVSDEDYWNDAGDGSGVNYVQMEDGSVRID